MKLLVQSDDYGLTRGITDGIVYGIENGVIRNTGLMTNMPSSAYAASLIKNYPHVCFGIDINLVSGSPISDPQLIPSLVDENGEFVRSTKRQGWVSDPFELTETIMEVENQVRRFIDLVGHQPEYLHPHSISTPNINKAHEIVAEKYGLRRSMQTQKAAGIVHVDAGYNVKPFPLEQQLQTDVTAKFMSVLDRYLDQAIIGIGGHAGFLDQDILDLSTYSIIRVKDLAFYTSNQLKDWIKIHNVSLITYRDI
ncbi:Chitooligosaccharide deacetylase ChbG [bioreactor metagenome]|uniref:Chitooligosaccharide deacetylase ChbG n=1 Tax=bioreactor metagenome TaxID=1076179 RepID=A0A645C6N1_9ZZZZ